MEKAADILENAPSKLSGLAPHAGRPPLRFSLVVQLMTESQP